jgi:hypothetical protein
MIAIIVVGTLGGKYLDEYLQWKFPIFTLVGSILSVFGALYITLKEFLKK